MTDSIEKTNQLNQNSNQQLIISRKNCNSLSFLDVYAKKQKSSLKDMLFLAKHEYEAKNI